MFAGPKESCDSRDPLSGLKNPDDWNPHESVHGLFTRANESLKVQNRKPHAVISREFSRHSESEYLADSLLDAFDLCW